MVIRNMKDNVTALAEEFSGSCELHKSVRHRKVLGFMFATIMSAMWVTNNGCLK